LGESFSRRTPKWIERSKANVELMHSSVCKTARNSFIFIGGTYKNNHNPERENPLIEYNHEYDIWLLPYTEEPFDWRINTQCVSDNKGTAYIFSGYTQFIPTNNIMHILDTVNMIWSTGSIENAPSYRHGYTSTMLSNGLIVYIGGCNDSECIPTNLKSNLKPGSFEILKLIGKGNFGKVFQVRKKDTNRIYAMKVLHKQDLIERREVEHTLAEKNILIRAESCPFLVGLKFSFQTRTHLYLVTDFMNGGELFWHLQNEVRLSEERAKFYAAEIVLALEHLHKYNIVYRDLKPENILLDATGHIALCDFGLCKENLATGQTTNTFCGTSEYLAPEVLAECGYGKSVDWWSLGILFYEMIAGF
ncbi:3094_t:CDS:2, partial [Entrophospora sp. SA101]